MPTNRTRNALSRFLRLGEDPQGDSEQSDRDHEHERVELQAAGLDLADRAPGFTGDRRETVDQPVDTLLVDVVVRDVSELAGTAPRVVQNVVDDVLVEPVDAARDRTLDAVHDDIGVEPIEVVLVDENPLTNTRGRVAGAEVA